MSETTETKSRTITPTSRPVSLLSTSAARTFTHVHPALLLAYFYLRFNSLVADPVPALLNDILPLTLLQSCYAVVCLPVAHDATSINSQTPKPKPTKSSSTRRGPLSERRPGPNLIKRTSTAVLALALTAFLSTPCLTIIMILFGAPLTTHHAQTYLCACHMSILAVFPLFYVYGISARIWQEIAGALLPFDEVWGATVGTVIGAWLGAVPIPLDWDREWQNWPITIVTGAYLGYVIGKLAGAYLFGGKRINFDP